MQRHFVGWGRGRARSCNDGREDLVIFRGLWTGGERFEVFYDGGDVSWERGSSDDCCYADGGGKFGRDEFGYHPSSADATSRGGY